MCRLKVKIELKAGVFELAKALKQGLFIDFFYI